MKIAFLVFACALTALGIAAHQSFRPGTLPPAPDLAMAIPDARPPAALTLAVLHTGTIASKAGLAYRGGDLREERAFAMSAVLVRHPQGDLLIDAGFGQDVDAHFATVPWLMRKTTRYERGTPAAAQLRAAGIEPAQLKGVILTHAHWDHVSGLADLPGAPVWLPQAELDFIRSGDRAVQLAARLGDVKWTTYAFADTPYLGFAQSYDVFQDGSVVIVPTPGHTPGSVITFVTLPDRTRYAFVGDLVWQREGVALPAERPWLSRRTVDRDAAAVRRWIAHMHALARRMPDLVVVPAHDRRAMESLPRFVGGAP